MILCNVSSYTVHIHTVIFDNVNISNLIKDAMYVFANEMWWN